MADRESEENEVAEQTEETAVGDEIDSELLPDTSVKSWRGVVLGALLYFSYMGFAYYLYPRLPSDYTQQDVMTEIEGVTGGSFLVQSLVFIVVIGGVVVPPIALATDIWKLRNTKTVSGEWTPSKKYYAYPIFSLLFFIPMLPGILCILYLYTRYNKRGLS